MSFGLIFIFTVQAALWPVKALFGLRPGFNFSEETWVGQSECTHVLFATHHKCGSQFAATLGKILGGVSELSNFNERAFRKTLRSNSTIVHFIRDPFALILSTYNYDLRGVEDHFHTRKLTPRIQKLLDCDSNLFFNCLWEKTSTSERLVLMARAYLIKGGIGSSIVNLETTLWFYQHFEESPNAMNLCLEDLKADPVGTLGQVCDLIKPSCSTVPSPSALSTVIQRACKQGICNSFEYRLEKLYGDKAYKCTMHEIEGTCGKFLEKEVIRMGSLTAALSWCATHSGKCRYISTRLPIKAYASPPTSAGSEDQSCAPYIWKVVCNQNRYFFPASLDLLYLALQRLDPSTYNRLKAIRLKMKCGARLRHK